MGTYQSPLNITAYKKGGSDMNKILLYITINVLSKMISCSPLKEMSPHMWKVGRAEQRVHPDTED